MCVIIDANLASLVFSTPPDPDFVPVLSWLYDTDADGCLVYGGRLTQELLMLSGTWRPLVQLLRAGRAILVPCEKIAAEEARVESLRLCRSNDAHVIALARVSGARVLCSKDRTLHQDFKNRQLISNPRGQVYQAKEHAHLLRHSQSCRRVRKGADQ